MTRESFSRYYKENYESFFSYKARHFCQINGRSYSNIDEIISQTVEILCKKLETIEESNINSFTFITMKNVSFNLFYNGFYNKAICCVGDISASDFGTTEEYYLDQSKLVDIIEEPKETIYKPKQIELLDNYSKLLPHEQKIIDCYIEVRSAPKVAKQLNTTENNVRWILKKVKTGAFKQKGFQNLNKNCYICGGKHFSKGLCSLHYQQKRRNG